MSVGGKKNEYDFQREEDDLNWWAEQDLILEKCG